MFLVNSISRRCSFVVFTTGLAEKIVGSCSTEVQDLAQSQPEKSSPHSWWERRLLPCDKPPQKWFWPETFSPRHHKTFVAAITILSSILFLPLTGCGSGTIHRDPPPIRQPANTYPGVTFSGKVLSGSVPLQGAEVQVYAAGCYRQRLRGNISSHLHAHNRRHRLLHRSRGLSLPQRNLAALPHRPRRQSRRPHRNKQPSHHPGHHPRPLQSSHRIIPHRH